MTLLKRPGKRHLMILFGIIFSLAIITLIALFTNKRAAFFEIYEVETDQAFRSTFLDDYEEGRDAYQAVRLSDKTYEIRDKDSDALLSLVPFFEFDRIEPANLERDLGHVRVRIGLLLDKKSDNMAKLEQLLANLEFSDFAVQVNLEEGRELNNGGSNSLPNVYGVSSLSIVDESYYVPVEDRTDSDNKTYRNYTEIVEDEAHNALFYRWQNFAEFNKDAIRILSDENAHLRSADEPKVYLFTNRFMYRLLDTDVEEPYPFTAWAQFSVHEELSGDRETVYFDPIIIE